MRKYIQDITVRNWLNIGVFNLMIVAALGLLMRLKIVLPLPFVNQQYILHAHSHFAFSGWVSHALMALLAMALVGGHARSRLPQHYQYTLLANQVVAFGMLLAFAWQGYAAVSILFSTLSVLISYLFAFLAWRDLGQSNLAKRTQIWFKAALLFLVISSLGTFYLAYLMKTGNTDPRRQLAAVYFYLHFQYNGWFFLMCMGLASYWFHVRNLVIRHEKWVQMVFVLGCIPAYMLSILWYDLPIVLYIILFAVVLLQLGAWGSWIGALWKHKAKIQQIERASLLKILIYCVVVAASIKFILQAFSVIPSLSTLAYSFRPIVIGYLHLVLLGVITLSILTYSFQLRILPVNVWTRTAVVAFVVGIVANELFLMIQGLGGLVRVYVPNMPIALVFAAVLMLLSLLFLLAFARSDQRHKDKLTQKE